MDKPSLLVVIPTYGKFEYAASALKSLFAPSITLSYEPHVLVVDDASPDWEAPPPATDRQPMMDFWRAIQAVPIERRKILRFEKNSGLTAAWNVGLNFAAGGKHIGADHRDYDYCCVTNSDVLFAQAWDSPLAWALNNGYSLVGPVTNAPGTEDKQNIAHYATYELGDDEENMRELTGRLWTDYGPHKVIEAPINGFCMMAKTAVWWENAFDATNVFRPRNDFNSTGQPNPTPLMTLNEYELQHRWHAKGLKTGFCPASFVFHYRAVTRGDRFKRPGWYRKQA